MPRKSPLKDHTITISTQGRDPVTLTGEQFEQLPEAICAWEPLPEVQD